MGVRGLFALPVSWIREEYRSGEGEGTDALPAGDRLKASLEEKIDGEILQARVSTAVRDGCLYVTLRAHCLENIAQTAEIAPP